MKFSQMHYERPDMDAAREYIEAAAERFTAAKSFVEADSVFGELCEFKSQLYTMMTLAEIRHTMDTTDEFYDGERQFLDEVSPQLMESLTKFDEALLASPFRAELAKKYNELLFVNKEMSLKTFSPEIVPDMQSENALTAEYKKLLASAQIPFEGETYTLSQLTPLIQDPDDARRLAACKAEDAWYSENAAQLDEIFDELTKLRDGMGKKLGYKDFTQLGYYRMTRNCYDKQDVEKFRESVVKYIVPIASDIYRRQAERLGKSYPMGCEDVELQFRSGNPCPKGTAEDILAQGKKFYHELSEETAQFIDVMYENELLDVLSRKGKAGGGYCTDLSQYKVPFIFANFNGTAGDVEVMTHEAGHAFACYTARNIVPSDSWWPTYEACEVHSMSMEFFAWPWAEGFFGPDARKFYYTHLSGALTFIPYGTMVDHFQHIVYEKPEMSPDERNAAWKELLAIYMPWIKLDEDVLPYFASGRSWQKKHHIYESPFYYIDYCLAQTVALQFWTEIQKDPKAAWEKYMAYTRPAGTKTFRELVAGAGLDSPFGEGALRTVAEFASKWLEGYDLSGLK